MNPRQIALTGATGFVGRHLTPALLDRGYHVHALVRPHHSTTLPVSDALVIHHGSLDRARDLEQLVAGCATVIHLAGAIRGRNRADFEYVNIAGTQRLITACRQQAPAAHLIHVSSLAARQPQLSWYASSKRAGEQCVIDSGLSFSGLRPPPVYGPDDVALAPLWRNLARGRMLRPGPAHARFSLLHVDDLIEAIARLVASARPSGAMQEIHDGRAGGYSCDDLARIAAQHNGRTTRVLPLPGWLLHTVAAINAIGARLTRSQPILSTGKVRELNHPDWVCDNEALTNHLHWAPGIRLEDCLPTLPGWRSNDRPSHN